MTSRQSKAFATAAANGWVYRRTIRGRVVMTRSTARRTYTIGIMPCGIAYNRG